MLIKNYKDDLELYLEWFNMIKIEENIQQNQQHFNGDNIIIVFYNENGEIYLEKNKNEYKLPSYSIEENKNIRENVQEALNILIPKKKIKELEPIAIIESTFKLNNQQKKVETIAVMARINLLKENSKHFYNINKIYNKKFINDKDTKIINEFERKFNYIRECNCNNFQDEEIDTNQKYRLRYQIHNKIVKRYILTSKRKKKENLIKIMSKKAEGASTLLDVSCGDNSLLFDLKYTGKIKYIVANDISWSQIEMIIKKEGVIFTNHNAITSPFKNNLFDFAYCSNTLHHIPNEKSLNILLNNLLRIGKKVVIFEIEDPKLTKGLPYYLNKYWYRGFLKDVGEKYLSFNEFNQIISSSLDKKANIKFSNFKHIQGNYMIAEITKFDKI